MRHNKMHKILFTTVMMINGFTCLANGPCGDLNRLHQQAILVLSEKYVLPENGKKGAEYLNKLFNAQEGIDCKDPKIFADFLTKKIRESTKDGHIYVEFMEPNNTSDDWISEWKKNAHKHNHGLKKVEIIDGNIAVVKISSFYSLEMIEKKLNAMFELISDAEGLILDLRQNGGGDSDTEQYITGLFFEKNTHQPLVFVDRNKQMVADKNKIEQSASSEHSFLSKIPMAVLIDERTFSAPEAMAYQLQAEGRSIIMGARSGGGANPLDKPHELNEHFQIWVPEIRPISLKTQTNWEGVGVIPDVTIKKGQSAIDTAQSFLLKNSTKP